MLIALLTSPFQRENQYYQHNLLSVQGTIREKTKVKDYVTESMSKDQGHWGFLVD